MKSTSGHRPATLAVLSLSLLLIGIDNTVLYLALPSVARHLHGGEQSLQWIADAYALVFAGLLLVGGSAADRHGRREALGAGLGLFALGSVGAAFAPSVAALLVARVVMGAGGALIMPATLSTVRATFPEERRTQAIATFSAVTGASFAVGPLIGGWLLANFWWGSVFLVNVPVVAVALIGVFTVVPPSRDPDAPRADLPGGILGSVAIGSCVFAIIEAPSRGWTSSPVIAAAALAVALGVIFVWCERTSSHPMLDLSLLRNRRFVAPVVVGGILSFALVGAIFVVVQYLQLVRGYTPLQAGVRTLPTAVAVVIAAPLGALARTRFGARATVSVGLAATAIGLFVVARTTPTTGYPPLGVAMVLVGLGIGAALTVATDEVLAALPARSAGVGAAFNDTMIEVGAALGVAVIGSALASGYASAMTRSGSHLSITSALASPTPPGHAVVVAAHAAFVHGLDQGLLVAAVVAVIGSAVAAVALRDRAPATVATADSALHTLCSADAA
jgi:EmrB/QacA subfamily drug resistance transporter